MSDQRLSAAIARTGGLIATALAGAVIAESGAQLTQGFHVGTLVGAAMALAAGIFAYVMLPARAAGRA